jgi:ubiquinone/menaquinone biosynthesis C-methylase UbiE
LALVLLGCHRRPAAPTPERNAAYDRWRRPEIVLAALGPRPGERIADLGAGPGYFTIPIADAVGNTGRVVALDVDGAALARIPRRPNVVTQIVRPDDPGLPAAAFDGILVAEVDHLVPDRRATFAKLAAALAPGGRIVVENRIPYREAALAAAASAGLVVAAESRELDGQFLVTLRRP